MKITDLKFGKDRMFALYIDGEAVCKLTDETVYKRQLKKGMELTMEDVEELLSSAARQAALQDGVRLLTRAPQTRSELIRKLKYKGHDDDAAQDAAQYLERQGYIDDRLYAEQYAHDAANLKKFGKMRIIFELRKKGISGEIIEEVTQETDEENQLQQLVEAALSRMTDRDKKSLDKLRRKLYARGYNIYAINNAIDEYIGGEDFEA